MQRFLLRLVFLIGAFFCIHLTCAGDTTNPTSVDPNYLTGKCQDVKEYTIADIRLPGFKPRYSHCTFHFRLTNGDKLIPGGDIFAKAIPNYGGKNFFPMFRFLLPNRRR